MKPRDPLPKELFHRAPRDGENYTRPGTRERVNQVIASFKQRTYISVDRNYRITIHNVAALERQYQ